VLNYSFLESMGLGALVSFNSRDKCNSVVDKDQEAANNHESRH